MNSGSSENYYEESKSSIGSFGTRFECLYLVFIFYGNSLHTTLLSSNSRIMFDQLCVIIGKKGGGGTFHGNFCMYDLFLCSSSMCFPVTDFYPKVACAIAIIPQLTAEVYHEFTAVCSIVRCVLCDITVSHFDIFCPVGLVSINNFRTEFLPNIPFCSIDRMLKIVLLNVVSA